MFTIFRRFSSFYGRLGFFISMISFMRSPVPNQEMPLAKRYISLKYNGSFETSSCESSPSSESPYLLIALAPYAISRESHPCLRGKLYSLFNRLIRLSGALLHVRFFILCLSSFMDLRGSHESRIDSRFFQQPCCRNPIKRKLSSMKENFLRLFAQLTIGHWYVETKPEGL